VLTSSPSVQTVKASSRDANRGTGSGMKKSASEFDPSRLNTKLSTTHYYNLVDNSLKLKTAGKSFEMRLLRSMEHTGHNTDLITHAYISKVGSEEYTWLVLSLL